MPTEWDHFLRGSGLHPNDMWDEISRLRAEAAQALACMVDMNEKYATMCAEVERLTGAIRWALGEIGDFGPRPKKAPIYWWRKELRKRSGITSVHSANKEE